MTDNIGVLTVGKDSNLEKLLPLFFASGTKDSPRVRLWTLAPKGAESSPSIDWKGDIKFEGDETKGDPSQEPEDRKEGATTAVPPEFRIREANIEEFKIPSVRIDFKSEGKDVDWLQLTWIGGSFSSHESAGNLPIFVKFLDIPKVQFDEGEETTFQLSIVNPNKKKLFITWSDNCGGTFAGTDPTVQWTAPQKPGTCEIKAVVKDKYAFTNILTKTVTVVAKKKEPSIPKVVGTFQPGTIDVGVVQTYEVTFEDTATITKVDLFQNCAPQSNAKVTLKDLGNDKTQATITWFLKDEGRVFPAECNVDLLVANADGGTLRVKAKAPVRYPTEVKSTIGAAGGEVIAYHPSPFFKAVVQKAGQSQPSTNPTFGPGVIRMHLVVPPNTVTQDTEFRLDAQTPGTSADPKMMALGRLFPIGFAPSNGTLRFFFFPPTEANIKAGDTFEHRFRKTSTDSFQKGPNDFVAQQDLSVEVKLQGFSDHAAFAKEPQPEVPPAEPGKEPIVQQDDAPDAGADETGEEPGNTDNNDAGVTEEPTEQPPVNVEIAKQFKGKGDEGIVFVLPEGANPADFTATSNCSGDADFRTEVREGKTVLLLTVTKIPTKPDCTVTIKNKGRTEKTETIPYGFEVDQSDNPNRVRQFIHGMMQEIVISYVASNVMNNPNRFDSGVRRGYRVIGSSFTNPSVQPVKTSDLKTGTILWTSESFKKKLFDHTGFFLQGQIRLSITKVDDTAKTVTLDTEGFDLTLLNQHDVILAGLGTLTGESFRSHTTFRKSSGFQIQALNNNTLKFASTNNRSISLSKAQVGETAVFNFIIQDKQGKLDDLRFTVGDTEIEKTVTLHTEALDWKIGTDVPNAAWLEKNFRLRASIYTADEMTMKPHEQQVIDFWKNGFQLEEADAKALYKQHKIGRIAAMERWFCVRKLQGKTTNKATHMDLVPRGTLPLVDAYSYALTRFKDPSSVFFDADTADRFDRLLTWGGKYPGNRTLLPLDEPDCSHYTDPNAIIRVTQDSKPTLDARTVVDLQLLDELNVTKGQFPKSCQGTNALGNCTHVRTNVPTTGWFDSLLVARALGMEVPFREQFEVNKTDPVGFCELKKNWSRTNSVFEPGDACRYQHAAGLGTFDVIRSIFLPQLDHWRYAALSGGQLPFAKYKAWDERISCSSRTADKMTLCPTQNPDFKTILARSQGDYIASTITEQSNQNQCPEMDLKPILASYKQQLPPPLPDSCSDHQSMFTDRDLTHIANMETGHLMPNRLQSTQLPDTRTLIRKCYEIKDSTRRVNGRTEKCRLYSFRKECELSILVGPFVVENDKRLACQTPFKYHHELPPHDQRFKVAMNTCTDAYRAYFTNWQFCQFTHMLRGGQSSVTSDWNRGYPLSDTVRCGQYDFNQNNRLDLQDAIWYFNLMYQGVRKTQASYEQVFEKFYKKPYPKAMLNDLKPHVVKLVTEGVKSGTFRPAKGFDLSRFDDPKAISDIQKKYTDTALPDGSFIPISSYTREQIFHTAIQTVLWDHAASVFKTDPLEWMKLMLRWQRTGISRSVESPRAVQTMPVTQSGLVLPMVCGMAITGRGPNATGAVTNSTKIQPLDVVIDQWANALGGTIGTTDPTQPGIYSGPAPGDLANQFNDAPSPSGVLAGSNRVGVHGFDAAQGVLRARVDNQAISNTNAIFAKGLYLPLRHRPMIQSRPAKADDLVPASPLEIRSRFDNDALDKDEVVTLEPPTGLTLQQPKVTAFVGSRQQNLSVTKEGEGFRFTIPKLTDKVLVTGLAYKGLNEHQGGAVRLLFRTQDRAQQVIHLIILPEPRKSPIRGGGRYQMLSHGVRWHHDGSITMKQRLAQLNGFGQSHEFDLFYSSQRRAFDQALQEYLLTTKTEGTARLGLAGGVPTGAGWGHTWDYRILPFFDGTSVTYVLVTPYGITPLKPAGSTFDPKGNGPFLFVAKDLAQVAQEDPTWLASLVVKVETDSKAVMEDKEGHTYKFASNGLLQSWEQFGHGARLEFGHSETNLTVESKGKKGNSDVTGWKLSLDLQGATVSTTISAQGLAAVQGPTLQLGTGRSLSQIRGDDGSIWTFTHSAEGPLAQIVNPARGALQLTFDAQQRLVATNLLTQQHDRFANISGSTLTPVRGLLQGSFQYSASQTTYKAPSGRTYTYALNASGLVTNVKVADASGTTDLVTYSYFKPDNQETLVVSNLTDHDNNRFAWFYDVQKSKESSTLFFTDKKSDGARGNWFLLRRVTTPNGERTISRVASGLDLGLVNTVTNPWGTTTFVYKDRLVTEVQHPGRTVKYTRETTGSKAVQGQILAEEDLREKRKTCYLYDSNTANGGNPLGQASARIVGAPGACPTSATNNASFRTFTLRYNAAGHVLEEFDPFTGGTTTMVRLADGRVTSSKGKTVEAIRYLGSLVQNDVRQGQTKDITFSSLLQPIVERHSVSGGARCRQHIQDPQGRILMTVGTTGDITLLSYDAIGRVTQRKYPADVRISSPCSQNSLTSLLGLVNSSKKAYVEAISYGPNTVTTTRGDVQTIATYGWFLDGKQRKLSETRLEKSGSGFAAVRHTENQWDERGLLLGTAEYGHTQTASSPLKTRACVPKGGKAFPTSQSVGGSSLALFNERYMARDGQGWVTQLCLPDGGKLEQPYDPRSLEQKTFQGTANILTTTQEKDIWGRTIAWKRGNVEIKRRVYNKDGGVTSKPQVYEEHRLNTLTGKVFAYERTTMDTQGRIATRSILDAAGKSLEDIAYTYDTAGRLAKREYKDIGSGRIRTVTKAWTDVDNLLQEETTTTTQKGTNASKANHVALMLRDEWGRLNEHQVQRFGITVKHVLWQYHGWGKAASMVLPLRQVTRTFSYDASGRITAAESFNNKDNLTIGELSWSYSFSEVLLEGAILDTKTQKLGTKARAMRYVLDYAGRPLLAEGTQRTFLYRYDARDRLTCKSLRVEFGKQVVGGRWDATYDVLSRRSKFQVFAFGKSSEVTHCDRTATGTPSQDLTYTYDTAGYPQAVKGTLLQNKVDRTYSYHANGLLKSETLSLDGLKQPSQLAYVYTPHGLLDSLTLKASLPATGDTLADISTLKLSYGTGNAWWSQRSQSQMEIKEYHRFLRYNRIGDGRFDIAAHHRQAAQDILGTGFEVLEDQLKLPTSQVTGKDHSNTVAKTDSFPEVRMEVHHRFDDHGRMLTRERLLYARARDKATGQWPFDNQGNVRNLFNVPFKVINNGKFESRKLRDMFSCQNTLDTYRQTIATGLSPKHPHATAVEDTKTAFASFADTQDFLTITQSWGVPLRRSCENVQFDTNDARPTGLHQRLLFFLPQFWVSPLVTNEEDRGRFGLYQLAGKKTFVYNERNQLVRMELAGMLNEAGGEGPFASVHEWIDNNANLADSHKIQYPGKVGVQGNLHFVHHRYWHSPHVLGGMLGWAFPESKETRAPMVIPPSGSTKATVEVRGALFSTLYDPAGRVFGAFNPPSTVPTPSNFDTVTFQFVNLSSADQTKLKSAYKSSFVKSHQHRLHVTLQAGNEVTTRLNKSWFGQQSSELDCPTPGKLDTTILRCSQTHNLSDGIGHLQFRTGQVQHPIGFSSYLDGSVLNVSLLQANTQPFQGLQVHSQGRTYMYLDRDHHGHAEMEHWQAMMNFQVQRGMQLLSQHSGASLAQMLRPAGLVDRVTFVPEGAWMSPLSHTTPLLSQIRLPTLPPYTIDSHSLQISFEQSLQIWSQVVQNEQNKIRDVLLATQGRLEALSFGLGIATIALPFMAPFLEGSAVALGVLRTTIITLELVQVALVAAEVAAVVQSQGIHQVTFMQAMMLVSGVLSTIIAAKVGLPASRLNRFRAFTDRAEQLNTIIGTSMLTALAFDGFQNGFNTTHRDQAAFFLGTMVFSNTIGSITERLVLARRLSPANRKFLRANTAERLRLFRKQLAKDRVTPRSPDSQPPPAKFARDKQIAEIQLRHKRWRTISAEDGQNALLKGKVQGPLKEGVLKHRVEMQTEVYKFGTQMIKYLDEHVKSGKSFLNKEGQLDIIGLVNFLKQLDQQTHANLTTNSPAIQQMFKTVTLKVQARVTSLGRGQGIDEFANLSSIQKERVIEIAYAELKGQITSLLEGANHPSGWNKAFNDKADSLGKDVIKHVIATHSRQAKNKNFYFNGKTAENFWNACNRKWTCVKDKYELKDLNAEEMYLLREFRFQETRKFINDAADTLGICTKGQNCDRVVYAPPAGSDGPTSDYDISWTVVDANGKTDLSASAALVGRATRDYIAAIGRNAEDAFEHGLFVPPPAFVKELKELSIQFQGTTPQIPESLAFFLRNLDPNNSNKAKALADMTTELNKFGAKGLSAEILKGQGTFDTFTNTTNATRFKDALERFITCRDPQCNAKDLTVWNKLFVDSNNKLLTNPTINPITLGLKKLITGCTDANCTNGAGQTAWKTKFFDETANKLRPDGEAVIKDFTGSLIADQMSLELKQLQIPGPNPSATEIQQFQAKFAPIIELDTHLKFLQPESYGTISTLVHIVEGIQKQKGIAGLDFLGSFFENMGYERHYLQLNQGDKIQKYGVRVADALDRMIRSDPRLKGVYSLVQEKKIKLILERLNSSHKTNAGSKFNEAGTLDALKKDMNELYKLAAPAMQKLFP
ncbi:MAG: hypothetical protein EP343_03395 [Deltaproteobacteria bacterium]|nr:MAG: hypothetical protein EP343_03395 [Deltaproteobacteria bacterium]